MTIANKFAAKLSVAFVAGAMIFSGFATSASAQTSEELQKMINDLLAQIAQLEAGASATTGGSACTTVTQPLTMGATGADVTALQNRLLADGEMIPAGATGYFGNQTRAALASWQGKHAVSPAVGYYGPITKAAMDASCVPADTDDTDEDTDEDDDSSDMTLSGEASLDTMEMDSASDDEVEEGAEDAEIGMLTLEFTNGDAEISRLDVALKTTLKTTGGEDPWDTFEEIQLWVDGDMIASVDASDEDDYLDEDAGSLRFSNLDLFAGEDEEVEITIAATVMNSVDLTGTSDDWTVQVDSLRFFDADGVATTEDSGMDFRATGAQSFSVNEAGFDDELIIKTSSNDPDASTLMVEDSSKSDWYTVFVFDLDTDDSINDIEINNVAFNVTTDGTSTVGKVIDDVEITIDGDSYDDWAYEDTTDGTTRRIDVDVDGDHVIDAGDRVEVEVMLRFKSANGTNYTTGEKVSLATVNTEFDAEGADDVVAEGSASSDTHTLLTEGIDTDMTDASAVVTTGTNNNDDYATFEIEVEITAFEQDVYIKTDGSDIDAVVVNNASATTSVASVVLDSSAEESNNRFEINEGETETITLTVTYGPGVAYSGETVRLRLNSIGFYPSSTSVVKTTQTTLPASDYRTGFVTLVN